MDVEIPLNRLIFGQDDGAGINARVVGRNDNIAELAANINARGQIENLVVKDAGNGFYSVSNGNRRLAAFHMIYGAASAQPIRCTLREVDEAGAFEDSLTTAVTAKQLHPVDQYEAFARLRDRHDMSVEEIAAQYGMTEREVEQALALGHLSPRIRDSWRKGEMKSSAAKAFTLAPDHKTQDEILDQWVEIGGRHGVAAKLSDMDDDDVKRALKIGSDKSGVLVEFVGIDAYVARGGKVTRDLFGTDHKVSDAKLAKTMATERIAEECRQLTAAGWAFAVAKDGVRNSYDYSSLKVEAKPTEEEQQKLDQLEAMFDPTGNFGDTYDSGLTYFELTGSQQLAYRAHREMQNMIALRPYTPKMMEKAGCFVGLDEYGMLEIEYGRVKPAQKEKAAEVVKQEKKEQTKAAAKAAKDEGKPAPAPTTLSNALKDRLEMTLVAATRDAIMGEPQLINSPLFDILARVTCAQIATERAWGTPDAIRTKLPSIRQVLNPGVFNAALMKRFDPEDYFSNAPRGLVIKAIAEAINPDEARKASTGKTKVEIWKFALANLRQTRWLPKELRTVHYKGPGSEGYVKPKDVLDPPPAPSKVTTTADQAKQAKAERETTRQGRVMKRAAASKKAPAKKRKVA